MDNKYVFGLMCCIVSTILTCVMTWTIIGYGYQKKYDKLQEQYAQVWFERNMYAENYYREIGKDDLADSFSVTKPFED